MGMLKRKLKAEEEAVGGDDDLFMDGDQISDDSTTSEEDEDDVELDETDTKVVENDTLSSGRVKVMILASRGVNARQRHLLDDLCLLLPHSKKESKFDTKRELFALNELAELNGCSHTLFFENRRPQELFIWASKTPSGPSVKFHVQNIYTLDELHMSGNGMKNTRPILTFDEEFSKSNHMQIMRELLESIFSPPRNHKKTRPYIDRVMHFGWSDDRIWVRNYQIKEGANIEGNLDGVSLEEIGPRFVLHPVRVFEKSFSGRSLWQNQNYIPTGTLRASAKMGEAFKQKQRFLNQAATSVRKSNAVLPENELDHVFD